MPKSLKRCCYAIWLIMIVGFAVAHALHLRADFPNYSPWFSDWAKYTDEGWYGNAAIRQHLFGNWYMPGDFNPAPAVPVWPFLEWILFGFTGVSIVAARALAVGFFYIDLLLAYLLLRTRAPRWVGMLAVTLAVTSPFLYAFSRLAILEPMLIACLLAALNLAVRLPRMRRPLPASAAVGLLFTLMLLTKTTAVFLLPAVAWALWVPLRRERALVFRCGLAAALTAAFTFAAWMAMVIHLGLLRDYKYLFFINKYAKPTEFYWPLLSLWWSFHGGLWADKILIPLTGAVFLCVLLAWGSEWSRRLREDPVFGAAVLTVVGYLLFMTYQNHPQPRYFTVVTIFSLIALVLGAKALLSARFSEAAQAQKLPGAAAPVLAATGWRQNWTTWTGAAAIGASLAAACLNGACTVRYAAHPQYTFLNAAAQLTQYIDRHPNGKRLLVSISGDDITMMTHLPTLCDDFGTTELVSKLADYQPGWWATWNDIDPGTLEDLHTRYSLEQVASFPAFDDPERNVLVLFKLHPLPAGQVREPKEQNLQVALAGDRIEIPIE